MEIEHAAVLGAGTMGSGIAAHLANAGLPVVLLDIVPGAAKAAVERMRKADPPPLMSPEAAKRITAGDLPTDLPRVGDADWLVEAVIERLDAKQALYAKLETVRKPGSVVSSNTSTIPLAHLIDGRSAAFAADFLITHFFNPPRFMRLLEVVAGPSTRADALAAVSDFADRRLGKGVVRCKDTPGFIANRIGTFWIQSAINAALDLGLTVEEADAIAGRPMGIPKTGVFGLLDLVGLDVMPHVTASMLATLPADDPYCVQSRDWPLLTRLIADGYTGRKGKGGFYRLAKRDDGSKVKEALNLTTGSYSPAERPRMEAVEAGKAGLRALAEHPDKGGRFARRVLVSTLGYAAALVPEICDDIAGVDQAMRLGYNWRDGPFEMIDRVGADWLAEQICADGGTVPPVLERAAGRRFYEVADGALMALAPDGARAPVVRPAGVLLLSDVKRRGPPVKRNGSASLWDIGDGVLCFEFTSKMNALDLEILTLFRETIELIGAPDNAWRALVVYNEGDNFSVGANLGLALFAANVAAWDQIETLVAEGQTVFQALRRAPFPVVGAPSGMALGGGCEILLHCDAIQAHAESYIGLVEAGVGVVPAWGGCRSLLARHAATAGTPGGIPFGPMPPVAKAFETISLAKVGKSAAEARALGFLRAGDGITMNRDRLLADAKARALEMVAGYRPPEPVTLTLPGPSGRTALGLFVESFRLQGKTMPHDLVVADALAEVLTGGATDPTETVDEDALLALERQAFMRLIRTGATLDRVEHMLNTGKPLRN